jgi:hypothetical protein
MHGLVDHLFLMQITKSSVWYEHTIQIVNYAKIVSSEVMMKWFLIFASFHGIFVILTNIVPCSSVIVV